MQKNCTLNTKFWTKLLKNIRITENYLNAITTYLNSYMQQQKVLSLFISWFSLFTFKKSQIVPVFNICIFFPLGITLQRRRTQSNAAATETRARKSHETGARVEEPRVRLTDARATNCYEQCTDTGETKRKDRNVEISGEIWSKFQIYLRFNNLLLSFWRKLPAIFPFRWTSSTKSRLKQRDQLMNQTFKQTRHQAHQPSGLVSAQLHVSTTKVQSPQIQM